ncbi:MAG TPA: hypothetical protein PLQ35_18120 [bacterium]|nr:hypothetical protein [bacterium]
MNRRTFLETSAEVLGAGAFHSCTTASKRHAKGMTMKAGFARVTIQPTTYRLKMSRITYR